LDDFMLRLLLVCAVVEIAVEVGFADAEERRTAWIEGVAIFIAVFVVAGVGSWNDWQKEQQFLKLQAESDRENVVRPR
jgi:magnesium-transporting ATPase (P-type)